MSIAFHIRVISLKLNIQLISDITLNMVEQQKGN